MTEKCLIYNVKRKMEGFKTDYLRGSHFWGKKSHTQKLMTSTNSTSTNSATPMVNVTAHLN